jgi:hypothetical protein
VATPRAVRIPRSSSPAPVVRVAKERPGASTTVGVASPERRENTGGSKRATRLAALFVVLLTALYAAFLLYDRTAPGGTASPEGNGVLLFTGIFLAFVVVGAVYALTPAPRRIEVTPDRVTVVGRWGRRRELPSLSLLSVSVVRRYPAGWLSDRPVELIELWGEDTPRRSYLVDAGLFAGANSTARPS